jgi:hypothetical protein
MTTELHAPTTDADDVLVCEYDKRPKGAPSFLDLQHAITAVVPEDDTLQVTFDPDERAAVEQLVAAERLCCPTIGFDLSPPPALVLAIRGTPAQRATLTQMLMMDLDDGSGA